MIDRFALFATRLCLPAEAIARRSASIRRQKQVVQYLWPKALCSPIGSFLTKTSLKNSDVDLLVSIPGQGDGRGSVVAAADSMKDAIIKYRISRPYQCTVIGGARVPILTYLDENETPPLKFDISFQKENAITNTRYLIERFEERPFMRDLVVVMKHWLRERQLNEVYKGGLGSYAVSLTVIGFFNFKRRTLSETEYQTFTTSSRYDMFLEYLEFWTGWKYNQDTMIPDPGIIVTKRRDNGKRLPFMLRIIDPTDSMNDVGKASHKITKVVTAMVKLKRKIQKLGPDMEEWEFDCLLSGTRMEREKSLKQKAHQDRNNLAMYNEIKKRIGRLENRADPRKAMKRSLAKMREKREEFLIRRPAFAAEVARAEYLLKSTGGPERGLDHDMLMANPGEENMQPWPPEEFATTRSQDGEKPPPMKYEEKSPEDLEREAKHAATIERKRLKREKILQKRAEKKREEKEMRAQKRIKDEMKRLRKEEESANMRPKLV